MATIQLADEAALKAAQLLEQTGRDDLALRIAVQPGGCSGLKYNFFFDDREIDGDERTEVPIKTDDPSVQIESITVVVDKLSQPYLQGSSLFFFDEINKVGFAIENPNSGGTCACGDSFY